MTRRKSVCLSRTLILVLVFLCQNVISRPQDETASAVLGSTPLSSANRPTDNPIRFETVEKHETLLPVSEVSSTSREVKEKPPKIGDAIKKVAGQLLQKTSNDTIENPVVIDTRIPPKVKNQLKHRIKTRNDDGDEPMENSHVGVAVPITMEELESENTVTEVVNESSTPNEGISTWILLNNPINKEFLSSTTESTKVEEQPKKQKPTNPKNKAKRPQANKNPKRPIIGSTNKSDLVAGGSAINENVYNKIKDTVLSNVQKNKNTLQRTTTTTTTTTSIPITTSEAPTTKKEPTTTISIDKVASKVTKKKNKHKVKPSTVAPVVSESALLPMEAKEQEIEIEVSTPTTTTKKPKRSSTRKKTKTKKRKTSKPKQENTTTVTSELKTNNKTKSSKQPKPTNTGPITTQIYNYFSREVMPSVGVGVIGLAGLVGIASYFLHPFTTPIRRTFEVDKKDDIYKNNAEEYGSESNGQAEEEMLGTVLAGMPSHTKHKLNPYAAQTPHLNRYQVKKDQDIRYRQVQHTSSYDPHYKVQHYAQQKTGIAHGAVYPEPLNYQRPLYETRHSYKPELKYDKVSTSYPQYPAVEPIYAAPQTGPTGISSYGSDTGNSVVYGVKPSAESEFKPVYPFDDQFYQQETTNHPVTYPPTSMFLGTNNEGEVNDEKYGDSSNAYANSGMADNKFVVGNVPKELNDESATPAVVPEHGPRNIRKRRSLRKKRGITQSIEDILKAAKDNKDIFLSNEIDEIPIMPNKQTMYEMLSENKGVSIHTENENVLPVYGITMDSAKDISPTEIIATTLKNDIVESISTIPLDDSRQGVTTVESEGSNELDVTTKSVKVSEAVTDNPTINADESSPVSVDGKAEATTTNSAINTETTTELKLETTSTMPPSLSPVTEPKIPAYTSPNPNDGPEIITYPPLNQENGFFGFLRRLVEFKYKLGLSILQTTSDSLNRYLRNMENTVKNVANASRH